VERQGLVRTGGRVVAALRVALGVAALVSPRLAAWPWVGRSAAEPAGTVLGRAAGARDVALGAGALLATQQGVQAERTWVVAGVFCDLADATTTAANWRRLPAPGRLLVSGAAVGAAVVGTLAARMSAGNAPVRNEPGGASRECRHGATVRRGTGRSTLDDVDDDIARLLALLDSVDDAGDGATVGTSVRMPVALRGAATAAVRAGLLSSVTQVTVRGLQAELEAVANRAVLDAHYREHPEARPDRWEVALAAAELSAHPLATRPDLVRRAADELRQIVDNPSPDEVLAYAAGLAAA
jgi:hypothetical protein